ncbi:MAG: carboxypeptidase-like regulatory domain-containing protein [Candidatus Thermoplasmatota archaeon]|nr:carboxypeptidase-like regulatory domain-containing protein [Candidatus Thermoplasmatota archaeon]
MDINERREALRARVRGKLSGDEEEEELVVKDTEILSSTTEGDDLLTIDDNNGILALASSLIFIGSILGIITGILLLQGNPAELLNNTLEQDGAVDVYGIVLEAESGNSIQGVVVELIDIDTNDVLQTVETNSYGYYNIENVIAEEHILRVSIDSYVTVERTFTPESTTQAPFTLSEGNGTVQEDLTQEKSGWSLENAVALSTGIALITILAGIAGINAAYGVRRATKYRRTQYLAGFALFSRGFIVFGPFLILCGMGLMILAREEFQDYEVA